jgi:uncharacterized lipoprotein YajG
MKKLFVCIALLTLAGCGAEVATTAATSAALKQQELEQAKKTLEMAQKKIDAAAQQMQHSAEQRGNDAGAK